MSNIKDLLHEPTPGLWYTVPCIKLPTGSSWEDDEDWVPVLGDWHADKFGDDHRVHIHYDLRFLTPAQLKKIQTYHEHKVYVLTTTPTLHAYDLKRFKDKLPPITEQHKVCQRYWQGANLFNEQLEEEFKDKELLPGRVCPHQGFKLGSFRCNRDGHVVCPGHNLTWDIQTSKLVPSKTWGERIYEKYLDEYGVPDTMEIRLFTGEPPTTCGVLNDNVHPGHFELSFYSQAIHLKRGSWPSVMFSALRPYIISSFTFHIQGPELVTGWFGKVGNTIIWADKFAKAYDFGSSGGELSISVR